MSVKRTDGMDLAPFIRNVPDFPAPGVQFKDITTLLLHPDAHRYVIDTYYNRYENAPLDAIVAMDARGFLFGSTLAYKLGLPLVLVRKAGKLPAETIKADCVLEYGNASLELHRDALKHGDRVVVVDDLLATGGTMFAAAQLIEQLGAIVEEFAFVIELPPLRGREKLKAYQVHSLVEFMVE